jgi:hypothetical protein
MRKECAIQVFAFALFFMTFSAIAQTDLLAQTQTKEKEINPLAQTIIKTYRLKHISPSELIKATKVFILDFSYSEDLISVRIDKDNVPAFEDILKKIDVEKRDVMFKIYLIEAHRKEIEAWMPIKDADLKKALQELGNLWSFKSYNVDGPSFITVKEGSGPEVFRLVSRYNMNMEITNVHVQGEAEGNRTISIETMKLWGTQNFVESNFLETCNKTLKENGFFVAGISGFGSDRALILVISAEVRDKLKTLSISSETEAPDIKVPSFKVLNAWLLAKDTYFFDDYDFDKAWETCVENIVDLNFSILNADRTRGNIFSEVTHSFVSLAGGGARSASSASGVLESNKYYLMLIISESQGKISLEIMIGSQDRGASDIIGIRLISRFMSTLSENIKKRF